MFYKLISVILGESGKYPLQHRIFTGFSLVGIFLSATSMAGNYFLKLPLVVLGITLFMTIFFCISYYLSRFRGIYKNPARLTVFILVFLFSPAIWISNGGSHGGSQYYLIFFTVVISSLTFGKERYFYVISLVTIITILDKVQNCDYLTQMFHYYN